MSLVATGTENHGQLKIDRNSQPSNLEYDCHWEHIQDTNGISE